MASIPTKGVIGRSKKMTLFSIDEKKCKRDGICAAVCP
ncbi:MAG: 4Fe-4S binding protein, partial [Deltaproteobacteria bacterium]|nr:4Fe-4S binding protein [Deltaproteobacteria bacterium]